MKDGPLKNTKNVNLKQRIVGAIVIVSLAIIIFPILLRPHDGIGDGESNAIKQVSLVPQDIKKIVSHYDKLTKQAEQMPALPVSVAIPIDDENKKQITDASLQIARSSNYKNAVKPKGNIIKEAYTLQLGSFSKDANAFSLRDKLRRKKYKAYIEKIKTANGVAYRVRVGPYLKYSKAQARQKSIKQKFAINGRILIYK